MDKRAVKKYRNRPFFVGKRGNICYNIRMDRFKKPNTETDFFSRLRHPTATIASGGAFSLACVLPSILAVVITVFLLTCGFIREGYQQTDWWRYVSFTVTPCAFALVTFIYLKMRKIPARIAIKTQTCSWKYYPIALCMQAGLFALSEVNGYFLAWLSKFGYTAQEIVLPSTDGFSIVGVLIAVAVLPAVFEELVFRGALFAGLRKNFSALGAVLLCGGLFAVYHQRPEQTLYQFCCGTAYALLAIRSGSVFPTMLAHFANNALIVVLYANGITAIPFPVFLGVLIIGGAMLIGVLGYLVFIDKNTSKTERDMPSQKKDFFLSASPGILIILLGWMMTLLSGF